MIEIIKVCRVALILEASLAILFEIDNLVSLVIGRFSIQLYSLFRIVDFNFSGFISRHILEAGCYFF